MNRHERRKARAIAFAKGAAWGTDSGTVPEGYRHLAERVLVAVRYTLDAMPEPPRFAMLPREMFLAMGLDEHGIGHRMARNDVAHRLVGALLAASESPEHIPTVAMLRAALELCSIPIQTCSLIELGLEPSGGGGGWQ